MRKFVATARKAGDLALALAARLGWLPPLAARLTVGLVFVWSGWGKLHHLPKIVEFFRSLHIPAPEIQAPFAAGTELVCGLLILFGLFTRLAALPLIVVMLVALGTALAEQLSNSLRDDGFLEMLNTLFGLAEFLYILLLLWLAIAGAGAISLDRLLFHRAKAGPAAAPPA